jgi:HAE1 family hydrophobic/amphiphilic exporter-1
LKQATPDRKTTLVRAIESVGSWLIAVVVGINAWLQRGTLRRVVTVAALVGASVVVTWLLWPQVEYLPTGNRNLVFGIVLPPPGYNIDQLMELGEIVEEELRPYWDVDDEDGQRVEESESRRAGSLASSGSRPSDSPTLGPDAPAIYDFFFVVRGRQVFMGVRAKDPLRAGDFVPIVGAVGRKLPGAFAVAKQSSLFEQGLTAGRTVDIEITGPDIERLVGLGGQILGQVMEKIPAAQAQPKPSLDLSSPEVHIEPKLLQAAEMAISSSDLGFAVDALVDGAYVSDYFLHGKKVDLTVMGEAKYADQTHMLGAVPIATPLGQLVPLSALAEVKLASGPEQVNHRERVRAITIEVTPPTEIPLEQAMAVISQEIVGPIRQSGQLDGGYQIMLAGTADKLRETWVALRFNVMVALLITYLLMAALFESWLYPLVVIFSVPLGAVGGVIGLQILNLFVLQPLDVLTMLGFVVLIGTVVNNPILIVHQSLNHMREDDMMPRDAVLESVRTRIRPIFMTTTTTVLGLLPLVMFGGAGSELYRGLGSVVLGGLVASTLFTLVLVPTLFSLVLDARQKLFGDQVDFDDGSLDGSDLEDSDLDDEMLDETLDGDRVEPAPERLPMSPVTNPKPAARA